MTKSVFLISALCFLMIACSSSSSLSYYREEAEKYTRKENYSKAITAYKRHIAFRLSLKKRPEWENPYFYLLLIGDLYLANGDSKQALLSYEEAEKNEVSKLTINDRFRYVAAWHEKNGDLEEALLLLEKYRHRDPLLFDLVRDRISKEIAKKDQP